MRYRGRATTTGNSRSLAFEKALFKALPAFASGRLEAEPISSHYLLVRSVPEDVEEGADREDPVVGAYLEFLSEQMKADPGQMRGLSTESLERARALVGDIEVDPDEDLGDADLLD